MSHSTNSVVVIGGGVSGLACAYRLKKLGLSVTLVEASPRVGGLVETVEKDGFLFESGPQSFQGTETLLSLIHDLGIDGELCKADPGAPRYILRQGRLRKVPMSPQAMLATSLLSPGTRWKIVSEPFRRTRPPSEEESVADFVRRKFGHEILEYLVSPFVSGVYAGDPEKLSLRAAFPTIEEWEREYGSVLRGQMKSRSSATTAHKGPPPLCSFRRGMNALMQAMGASLGESALPGACASGMSRSGNLGDARYEIRVVRGGREETIVARAVVLATPAYVASHLVGSVAPPLASILSGIAYASLAVVGAGYYKRQASAALDGFGVLIPRSEKHRTLGIVGIHRFSPAAPLTDKWCHELRRWRNRSRDGRKDRPGNPHDRAGRTREDSGHHRLTRLSRRVETREGVAAVQPRPRPRRGSNSRRRAHRPGIVFRRQLPRRTLDRQMRRRSVSDRRRNPRSSRRPLNAP